MTTDTLPETMFAWRKHKGLMEPVWEEVPIPEVSPTGVLCKMIASGVCHSDHTLVTLEMQPKHFHDQFTLGHEGCGEIVKVGDQVTEFQVGDIVAMYPVPGCGAADCTECARDLPQLCPSGHHSGIGQDGFFAPYAAVDQRALVLVPDGVTPSVAAIACDAVTTAYHAVTTRGKVNPTDLVFLFGIGGLGFNGLQILRHLGARVIISEINQDLLDAAEAMGIPKEDLAPAKSLPTEFVKEAGLEEKIDVVIDFVGTHQTFSDAQRIVRHGGKIISVGSFDLENTLHMKIASRKALTFVFSYGGQIKDLKEVLALIAQGKIQPRVENAMLEDFWATVKDMHAGKLKSRIALLHG
ncbi:N-benzyl-3-pyrrolidinol dehydrogenase [Thozetella sp. PMI_491]|nr:N-benzyl-3-pyrrolidinol dehydrogenase [Thozetella sp. PMI_491]